MSTFLVAQPARTDMAYSNAVYVNAADLNKFPPSENQQVYTQLPDGIVWKVKADSSVNVGDMAFNRLQRTVSQLSAGQRLTVNSFVMHSDSNINLSSLRLEVDLLTKAKAELSEDALIEECIRGEIFAGQIFCKRQEYCVDFKGSNLKFTVLGLEVAKLAAEDEKGGADTHEFGIVMSQTEISIEPCGANKALTFKRSENRAGKNIFSPSFKFEDMGIGGLDKQFGDIFRRAFASRTFPPALTKKLGIHHVKGILLYGPPGTGKTLIARQIGKMLNGREPKIVNGPEILNKFVGASEENIRKLFVEAEEDQKKNGDDADLHIIIFDEIDAVCKQRGSSTSGTGVHDTVVNQLLTKMDGVEQLNNILVIGMTNRKELIDEALLRPGRFEVHVEIGLADEAGRLQILKIHTKKMVEANFMAPDVDLHYLAEHTKNFSGAELEGLVKSAASFAFYGQVDVTKDQQVAPKKQLATMKVTMEHFKQALQEVKPAFGVEEEELKRYLRGGFIDYGPDFNHLLNSCKTLIEQVRNSPRTPLLSVLLQGASGCGKTALATYLGISSQFPFVKMVSAEDMVGWGEMEKARKMEKIFRDAYKSPLSIIIIDEIERLLEYVSIGPRFSNTMLQTMLVLLKKPPPTEGRKLLLIGTTSAPHLLEQMSFRNAFNVVLEVPQVKTGDEIRTVFEAMQVPISGSDLDQICEPNAVGSLGIKQLLNVIEMSSQSASMVTSDRFFECLRDSAVGNSAPARNYNDE